MHHVRLRDLAIATFVLLVATSGVAPADEEARGRLGLRVLVTDEHATPLPGVRVTAWAVHVHPSEPPAQGADPLAALFAPPTHRPAVPAVEAVTGEDGRCRLEDLPAEGDLVVVAHASAPDVDGRTMLTRDAGWPESIRIAVRSGKMLRGRVVDAKGGGLRAWIRATATSYTASHLGGRPGAGWSVGHDVETDADGRFAFPTPAGHTTHLVVLVPGRRIWSGVLTAGAEEIEVPVERAAGGRAFGTVCDAEGSPVREAHVAVLVDSGDWPGDRPYVHALATTDAEGRWEAADLPRGRLLRIVASKAGYAVRQVGSLQVPLTGPETTPVDAVLERPRRLTGRVLDAEGRPVVGAEVFEGAGLDYTPFLPPTKPPSARTDANGRYLLETSAASQPIVSAQPPGWGEFVPANWVRTRRGGAPKPGQDVDVTLPTTGAVRGTVRSVEGEALAGVEVFVGHARSVRQGAGIRVVTGADGTFLLHGLRAGATVLVRARRRGVWGPDREVVIEEAGQTVRVDVVLQPAGRIEGRARDESGRGLAHVTVRAFEVGTPDEAPSTDRVHEVTADAAGRFGFDRLPPGRPVRVCLAGEDAAQGVEVTPSTRRPAEVDLVRPTGHSVSGRVVDAHGAGVPLVTVAVAQDGVHAEVRTGARGHFAFTHLPPPEDPTGYRLRVRWETLDARFPPGTTDTVLPFHVTPARWIEGRVLLPDGRPVPQATVRLRGDPGAWRAVRAGWFRIHLGRDVETVGVMVRDPRDGTGTLLPFRRVVWEGRLPEAPLVLRLVPGLSVTGRLLDEGGMPVAGREVYYAPTDETWWERHDPYRATTKADGSFAIAGLREGYGTVGLKADLDWWDPEPSTCRADEAGLEIRSRARVPVRGRVRDSNGAPIGAAHVFASVQRDPDPRLRTGHTWSASSAGDGRFELPRIPAGARLLLRVPPQRREDGYWFGASIECTATRDASHEIVLLRAETVAGLVLDEDGTPVVDVPVYAEIPDEAQRALANAARLETRTDAEGRFRLGPLPPEARVDVVLPSRSGSRLFHFGARVEGVEAGTEDLLVRVRRAADFTCILMGPEERPIPDAHLRLEPWYAEDQDRPTRTWRGRGDDVEVRIEGLYPGRYLLTLSLKHPDFVVPEPFPVDVPSSDLVLQLRRAHPVRGRVLEGGERPRVRFVVEDAESGGRRYRSWPAGRQGRFVIPNEKDVPGTLVVETRDGRFDTKVGVRPSDGPFELVPKPGVRVAGKIENLPPRLAERVRMHVRIRLGDLQYEASVDRVDEFRFRDVLPAGRYAIEIVARRMKGRVVGPETIEGGDEDIRFRYVPSDD